MSPASWLALLLVGETPSSGSAASATMECRRLLALWEPATGGRNTLVGPVVNLSLVRNRMGEPVDLILVVLCR